MSRVSLQHISSENENVFGVGHVVDVVVFAHSQFIAQPLGRFADRGMVTLRSRAEGRLLEVVLGVLDAAPPVVKHEIFRFGLVYTL